MRIVISANAAWNIVNFRSGLIKGLQGRGHEIVALAPPDAAADRMEALGISYMPLPMDKKGLSPWKDLHLLWNYRRLLRRIGPAVFLGYTAKPNVYGSLAAQSLGIKVINNVSGLGTAFIRGGLLSAVVSRLYRIAFRRSATVFFQNPEDEALFLRKRLVSPARAKLLPGSGIDLARFSPACPPAAATDSFRFLLVGRLLWDKGIGEYVQAARIVRARVPGVGFQILGFVDAENRTAVPRSAVDEWVAEGIVDYLGAADDVRPFVAAADCVVLPSYREGLPRTLLEAAAIAKPLIATDVPGCRQIVEDGRNGFLCAPRDAHALAEAMLKMLEASPDQRRRWGEAGRRKVEEEYDERLVIARYVEAIEGAGV